MEPESTADEPRLKPHVDDTTYEWMMVDSPSAAADQSNYGSVQGETKPPTDEPSAPPPPKNTNFIIGLVCLACFLVLLATFAFSNTGKQGSRAILI